MAGCTVASWPFELDNVEHWAYVDNFLSPEECAEVIKLGLAADLKTALINEKNNQEKIVKDVRESEISWIAFNEDTKWLYQKLSGAIVGLNAQFFNFDIYGLIEGIQFTKYNAPNGKYGKHIDKMFNGVIRKLSISVQLSDPQDYDGGELLLHKCGVPDEMPKEQGKLVIFPSYTLHEVKPVLRGTRYSLVAWVAGKQFK
jgi:PKHD-type hydroxylase